MGKGLKKRDSSADRTSFRKTVENELYTRVGIKVVVKKIASRKGQVRRWGETLKFPDRRAKQQFVSLSSQRSFVFAVSLNFFCFLLFFLLIFHQRNTLLGRSLSMVEMRDRGWEATPPAERTNARGCFYTLFFHLAFYLHLFSSTRGRVAKTRGKFVHKELKKKTNKLVAEATNGKVFVFHGDLIKTLAYFLSSTSK